METAKLETQTSSLSPAVTAPVCTPPLESFCTAEGCSCVMIGGPPPACQVSVVYPAGLPSQAEVTALPAGCDAAGAEIALAVALSRLLQRP